MNESYACLKLRDIVQNPWHLEINDVEIKQKEKCSQTFAAFTEILLSTSCVSYRGTQHFDYIAYKSKLNTSSCFLCGANKQN